MTELELTIQGHLLHVQHVYICAKVVEDARLLTCNVACPNNDQPAMRCKNYVMATVSCAWQVGFMCMAGECHVHGR